MTSADEKRDMHEQCERDFGLRVRAERRARRLSQEDLAALMTAEGFEMHQTTIDKLESGSRPIRLAEAEALKWVFVRTAVKDMGVLFQAQRDRERSRPLSFSWIPA